MLKIKIGNTTFEYLEALETEEFFNGSSRRTITVTCNPNVISIDELNALIDSLNERIRNKVDRYRRIAEIALETIERQVKENEICE